MNMIKFLQYQFFRYIKFKKFDIAYSKFIRNFKVKNPLFEHEINSLNCFQKFIVYDLIKVYIQKLGKQNFDKKEFIKAIYYNEKNIRDFYGYHPDFYWLAKEIYHEVLKFME